MAIETLDGLVAGLTGGQTIQFSRPIDPPNTARWGSAWVNSGTNDYFPPMGSTPPTGAGEAPTNSTAGALLFTNPGGASSAYLAVLTTAGGTSSPGQVMLYDRLVHTSGLSGTVTTAQTVNSAAITRPDANGEGVELWLEWYTTTGSTLRTFTASYTNQAGTSGRTAAVTPPEQCTAGAMWNLPLQAGDTGVRSVQSITLSGTTGTAGNFGVTLLRRLAVNGGPLASPFQNASGGGVGDSNDAFGTGLPEIHSGACLALAIYSENSTNSLVLGQLCVAVG